MADLIAPVVAQFIAILTAMDENTLGDLPKFSKVTAGISNMLNAPAAFVMPIRTQFPGEGEGTAISQDHQITIRLGLQGTDPQELTARCMAYVQAVDAAIRATPDSDWPPYVMYVFCAEHDYGSMYTRNGALTFWPDLHLLIQVQELP